MTETPNISTMESRIRQSYASLSQAERKLADVVLSRQREVLGYSATELASLAGTSKSSAARFFRSLGYAGYDEFRQALRQAQLQQSPLGRMAGVRRKDSVAQQFHSHLQLDTQRLQEWG
ncbi:MAG: MurR/RpiR family transcriptional regulator, partial [Comamonas sp.]|nr:MurR/RpiR family transcriptional regulator [Comamonas sp.]